MLVKAVIFDRDGVLLYFDLTVAVDFFQPLLPISLQEITDRWKRWGEKVGYPRTLAEERTFFRSFWDAVGDEFKVSSHVRIQLHQFDYTSCLLPFPDAAGVLFQVRKYGLKIGVLSNFSLASVN